jgi:hypothetical protein
MDSRRLSQASAGASRPHYFHERKAKQVLASTFGWDDRKCKKVLHGLCHWRRLIMRRYSFGDGVGRAEGPGIGSPSSSSASSISFFVYEIPNSDSRSSLL